VSTVDAHEGAAWIGGQGNRLEDITAAASKRRNRQNAAGDPRHPIPLEPDL
jgi:hypothetical protein